MFKLLINFDTMNMGVKVMDRREEFLFENSPYRFKNISYEEGMMCLDILNKCKDFNDAEETREQQRCQIVVITIKKQDENEKGTAYSYNGAYNLNSNNENRCFEGKIFITENKIDVVNLIERLCVTDDNQNKPKRYRTTDTFIHLENDIYERKSSYNYLDKRRIRPKKVTIKKQIENIKK